MAKSLSVAEATAQVYVIDTIVQGKGGEADYRRLLQEMDIGNRSFGMVTQLFSQSGLTLREIRETTSLTYNQIRAVTAVSIRGFELN